MKGDERETEKQVATYESGAVKRRGFYVGQALPDAGKEAAAESRKIT